MQKRIRVLNCKQGESGQALSSELQRLGYEPLWQPLQVIEPVLRPPIEPPYQLVIFTSKNAVIYGLDYFDPDLLSKTKILAIGPATQALLAEHGLPADSTTAADSEALVARLISLNSKPQSAVIVKGEGGRDHIQQHLLQQQIPVTNLCCYRRLPISQQQQQLLINQLQQQPPQWIIISNAESLTLLQDTLNQAQLRIDDQKLIVPSQRIADFGLNLGFTTVFVSAGPMNDAIINTLTQQLPNRI